MSGCEPLVITGEGEDIIVLGGGDEDDDNTIDFEVYGNDNDVITVELEDDRSFSVGRRDIIIAGNSNVVVNANNSWDFQNTSEALSGFIHCQGKAFYCVNTHESELVSYVDDWNYDAVNWYTKDDEIAVKNALENQLIAVDMVCV